MKILETVTDPTAGKLSSTRIVGLLLAVAAIAFAFVHPESEGVLVQLLGASMIALGLRKKAE